MIKLKSISSIFSFVGVRFSRNNKVELTTTKTSLTKKDILNILKSATSIIPKSINTLIVKKYKFGRGGNFLKNEKYCSVQYYKRVLIYKKIIITFNHSKNKAQFLNDFGIN